MARSRSRCKGQPLLATHRATGLIRMESVNDSTGHRWERVPIPDTDVVLRINPAWLPALACRAARNKSRLATWGPITAYVGGATPGETPLITLMED